MVRFKDFFLGDILTSMTRPLIDAYFMGCFFKEGEWKLEQPLGICTPTPTIILVMSLIPFHIRFWQCINRFYYTKLWFPHLVNAGKYLTSIAMIVASYFRTRGPGYLTAYICIGLLSTAYSYAWDLKMDWGLLRGTQPGKRLLRDKLKFPASFYYFSMISNLALRLAWVLTLIPSTSLPVIIQKTDGMFFLLAVAEAYRRAQWSLFRVENENVNNFEKYRSIMEIPKLPDENQSSSTISY